MSLSYANFSERLARAQLKNTSAVEEPLIGVICPRYEDTILDLTNEGLVDLSTRLPLIRKLIDLVFVDSQHLYPMDAVGSYFDATETEPFNDEFIKTIGVYDGQGELYVPDTNGHITTPTYNSLRFTTSIMDNIGPKVRIQYQVTHPVITANDDIDLPSNLYTALQLYVAGMFLSHIGGEEHTAKGDKYYGDYLSVVNQDKLNDISSTSEIDEDCRFQDRGFV